jgi:Transposase and inactivated derivatives
LRALGHEVRLIPAAYVKPFVKRNKNDARDAAAICAALARPDMRFVAIKSVEASRGLARARELLVKQHRQLTNCVRGLMSELGVVAAQGRRGLAELAAPIEARDARMPEVFAAALRELVEQAERLKQKIAALEKQILTIAKENETMRQLATIPGVGGLTAHAIVAAIGEGKQFRSARNFAAWCGLTPLEHSSGAKRREKGISRMGDIRLRKLFALGASTVMRNARSREGYASAWQRGILARRPMKVAVLAPAKTARIAWAMLRSGEVYKARKASRLLATAL